MRHIHLIGIGGSGLSAIARVLLERGEQVSGSDRQRTPVMDALEEAGAAIYIGHQAQNIHGADIVVRSSAIRDDNVEVEAARKAGIPVIKRVEFIRDIVAGYQVIAVAGSHGKTTTTAMIAWILTALQLDPSFIIGGISFNLGTNAHSGKGPYFVIEADEYDRMFLGLNPAVAVVTNVEYDHPDYFPSPEAFYQAFQEFVSQIETSGVLLACADDAGSSRLLIEAVTNGRRAYGYSLERRQEAVYKDYYARIIQPNQISGYDFEIHRQGQHLGDVSLQVSGMHNVSNALAALAAVDQLQISVSSASQALGEFTGTGRRFEIRGERSGVAVVDDYAHHPTEIRTTLAAARARYPQREIWAVWQPHTYSRTRSLFEDYVSAFEDADHVLVTEIYAARESSPKNGFSARQVVDAMHHPDAHFTPGNNDVVDYLLGRLHTNAVLVVLSAGDADQISTQVLNRLG